MSAPSSSTGGGSSSSSEFWLLKIPNFLYDQWEEAKRTTATQATTPINASKTNAANMHLGQPIAHIWIEKKPPKVGARKMKLVVPNQSASNTPLSMSSGPPPAHEFTFQTKPKTSPMLVFGASVPPSAQQIAIANAKTAANPTRPQPTPEAFKLEGEVSILADCLPRTNTPQYKAMLAARMASTLAKQHTVRAIDAKDANTTSSAVLIKRKVDTFSTTLKNNRPEKRVRMEEADLEKAVLELMSLPQYAAITINKLGLELQQPINAVSDMVKKLCIRLEEGPNKGLFALKPEYKIAADHADAQPMGITSTSGASGGFRPTPPPPSITANMFAVKSEVKREF